MHAEDGRIISNFIVQALRGEPLTIYGDGRQTRSFCFVDDMVEALLALMASSEHVVGPINLGNPDELSVLDVAGRVRTLTGSRSPIEFQPLPVDDPRRRRPDIACALQLLRWRPRIDLDSGLRYTIADFADRIAGTPARAINSLTRRAWQREPPAEAGLSGAQA
jgi:UDP-glucuronate decarboxylase